MSGQREQADRIASIAEREGFAVVAVIEELQVGGGTPLANRAGLRRAVEMVEAGEASVVVIIRLERGWLQRLRLSEISSAKSSRSIDGDWARGRARS